MLGKLSLGIKLTLIQKQINACGPHEALHAQQHKTQHNSRLTLQLLPLWQDQKEIYGNVSKTPKNQQWREIIAYEYMS